MIRVSVAAFQSVGREVMGRAAAHLTPVTLELGGKSPCIVDATARLDLAAKRLVFGKLLNCGQTCVAPDYLLIDRRVKEQFLSYMQRWITAMYGQDPLDNRGYVRMVSRKHFDRVMGLIDPAKVVKTAIQAAASTAGVLLTTGAVMSEIPEEKPAAPQMGAMPGMM